ncbi:MAG: ribosomal RNA small subunit methyltransferase A [Verrucomicrobia bacterium RIFCSPLOWO2_12_FULL_64_8]|nr:MAG: ribosomal RNA small subunit methyltransferase A [Verrucomicrobia bacterium RIFCSPLOWO2_12_FULL_64_8]
MPLTPSETRRLLAELQITPRRFLGQNFLVDGNIVRKSIELAAVRPGEAVVEIGPGLGTLTVALLEAGAEVWAVEKDRRLHAFLAAEVAPRFPGRLHLCEGDAVEQPLAGLPAARAAGGFKVVANLPFAISSPWMDTVLAGPLPGHMVLMLQREAAARYTAEPGTKDYGAISIFLQSAYAAAAAHRVSPACFHPRPEVESCLLRLARRPEPFVFPSPARRLIRACFQQRRKQIASLLRGRLAADAAADWLAGLTRAGLGPRARPEQISLAQWRGLAVP